MSTTVEGPNANPPVTVVVADGPVEIVAQVAAAPEPKGGRPWKAIFLISLPLLAALYVYTAARTVHGAIEYQPAEHVTLANGEPDGAALFVRNCARCHGPEGHGGGLASPYLDPPARKFGEDKFRLGTTSTGVPSDEDLMYLIEHGIPGTAMPNFPDLNEAERRAIAEHVRRLAYSGLYAKLYKQMSKDEDPDPVEIHQRAAKQLTVGDPLPLPDNLIHPGPNAIAHGKDIFQNSCATCHGKKGDGKDVTNKDMKDENLRPIQPRDLARGVYKGGGEPDRLFARISLGMPGTPMPDLRILSPADRADVVNYVRSLTVEKKPLPTP
jgi:mono/diheme cytochrome c family protein